MVGLRRISPSHCRVAQRRLVIPKFGRSGLKCLEWYSLTMAEVKSWHTYTFATLATALWAMGFYISTFEVSWIHLEDHREYQSMI